MDTGIGVKAARERWYHEIGQGMGPALNAAASTNAYVLSDRGTWLSFRNRGTLAILVEGDNKPTNQYGVMLVNPARHPDVRVEDGQAFIDWLISAEGQSTIAEYKIGGQQLFFPNASMDPRRAAARDPRSRSKIGVGEALRTSDPAMPGSVIAIHLTGLYPSVRVFRNSMMSASSRAVIAGSSPRSRSKGGSLTSTLA
jgi:ABC-type glycerol-3-phosphate transport system substrate-binding protein